MRHSIRRRALVIHRLTSAYLALWRFTYRNLNGFVAL